jgi:hypothetical protein
MSVYPSPASSSTQRPTTSRIQYRRANMIATPGTPLNPKQSDGWSCHFASFIAFKVRTRHWRIHTARELIDAILTLVE